MAAILEGKTGQKKIKVVIELTIEELLSYVRAINQAQMLIMRDGEENMTYTGAELSMIKLNELSDRLIPRTASSQAWTTG